MNNNIIIKINKDDLIELIKSKNQNFDIPTAELFISCYTENTDSYDENTYLDYLNSTEILTEKKFLEKFNWIGNLEEIKQYKKDYGLEYTIDLIDKGKNKGKYLVIEGLM